MKKDHRGGQDPRKVGAPAKKKKIELYPLNCNKELECQVKGIYRTLNSNEEQSMRENWVSKSTVNCSYWNFLNAEIINGFTYWQI
jgi:hypothetical protein